MKNKKKALPKKTKKKEFTDRHFNLLKSLVPLTGIIIVLVYSIWSRDHKETSPIIFDPPVTKYQGEELTDISQCKGKVDRVYVSYIPVKIYLNGKVVPSVWDELGVQFISETGHYYFCDGVEIRKKEDFAPKSSKKKK